MATATMSDLTQNPPAAPAPELADLAAQVAELQKALKARSLEVEQLRSEIDDKAEVEIKKLAQLRFEQRELVEQAAEERTTNKPLKRPSSYAEYVAQPLAVQSRLISLYGAGMVDDLMAQARRESQARAWDDTVARVRASDKHVR